MKLSSFARKLQFAPKDIVDKARSVSSAIEDYAGRETEQLKTDISSIAQGRFRAPVFHGTELKLSTSHNPLQLLGGEIVSPNAVNKLPDIPGVHGLASALNIPSVAATLPLGGGLVRGLGAVAGATLLPHITEPIANRAGIAGAPIQLASSIIGASVGHNPEAALNITGLKSGLKEEPPLDPEVAKMIGIEPPASSTKGMIEIPPNEPTYRQRTEALDKSANMLKENQQLLDSAKTLRLKNEIHSLADQMGIPWDNNPKFLKFTKDITGKEHLDDLNPQELQDVYDTLSGKPFEAPKPIEPSSNANPELFNKLNQANPTTDIGEAIRRTRTLEDIPPIAGAAEMTDTEAAMAVGKIMGQISEKEAANQARLAKRGASQGLDINPALRLVMSGFSPIDTLVQGLLTTAAHPETSLEAAVGAGKALFKGDTLHRFIVEREKGIANGTYTGIPLQELVDLGKANLTDLPLILGLTKSELGPISRQLIKLPGFKQSTRAFETYSTISRLKGYDTMYQMLETSAIPPIGGTIGKSIEALNRHERIPFTMEEKQILFPKIVKAVDLVNGYAEKGFPGGSHLYAARFLKAQISNVLNAFTKGGLEGAIARHYVFSLLGYGTLLTTMANTVRGESTDLNLFDTDSKGNTHLNPRFMKIKNIGGADVSVFGSYDSLLRLVARTGLGVNEATSATDAYTLRKGLMDIAKGPISKLAPLESTAVNIAAGYKKEHNPLWYENTDVTNPEGQKNLAIGHLPFIAQPILQGESKGSIIANLLQAKANDVPVDKEAPTTIKISRALGRKAPNRRSIR